SPDAADVRTVTQAFPLAGAGEGDRGLPVQRVAPGADVQLRLRRVQVLVEAHLHTADGVHHPLHTGHVHDHEVVDEDVGHVLEGADGAAGRVAEVTAGRTERERHVPHPVVVAPALAL